MSQQRKQFIVNEINAFIAKKAMENLTGDQTRPELIAGPDVPLLFLVERYNKDSAWGVALPTSQPEHGRAIRMLSCEGFGWWYPEKTLEESVRNLFASGEVSEVVDFSVIAKADD